MLIKDINDPVLTVYKDLKESQLKHYYEPEAGLFICESPRLIKRALDAGYLPESFLADPEALSEDDLNLLNGAPVYTAPVEILTKITGYHLTEGMLCAMRRKPLPAPEQVLTGRRVVVLEDIENPTNVGAIFRSAAALGMDAVLLTEGCADPLYRRAARVSMGGVFQIPWTYIPSLDILKALGYKMASMALSDYTVSIDDPLLMAEEHLAILLGNENNGLLPETIAASDYIIKIPMANDVDSLNVAAAAAIAFWQLK